MAPRYSLLLVVAVVVLGWGDWLPAQPKPMPADNMSVKTVLELATRRVGAIEEGLQRIWLYSMIAEAQARAGFRTEAAETLRKALREAIDSESDHRLLDVAEYAMKLGDSEAALLILKSLDDPSLQRDQGLANLSSLQARRGDVKQALATAEQIPSESAVRDNPLKTIAARQAETGDLEAANATVKSIGSQAVKAQALLSIAGAQLRAGNKPAALKTLEEARQIAGPMDAETLIAAAGVEAEAGLFEDAEKTARKLEKGDSQDRAWQNIALAQARKGDINAAKATADRISNPYYQGETLAQIVNGLIRAKDLPAARRMAESIESSMARGDALIEVGKAEARNGERQNADEIFETVYKEAKSIKDNEYAGNLTAALLSHLAAAQAAVGQETAARNWIAQETSDLIVAYSLLGLAKGLIEQQRPAQPPKIALYEEEVIPGEVKLFPAEPTADAETLLKMLSERAKPRPDLAKAPRWKFGERENFRGRLILFGGTELLAVRPDGTGLETLHELGKGQSLLVGRVSPDGRRIALSITGTSGQLEVWVLDAAGKLKMLSDDGIVQAWSPDGKRLACYRGSYGRIQSFFLDLDSSEEQTIPIPATDWVDDWSPGGNRLSVVAGNPDKSFNHPTKGVYPLRKIYLVKPDGSGREDLKIDPLYDTIESRFSPDGSKLLYHLRKHNEGRVLHSVVVYELKDHAAKEVFDFNTFFKGNRQLRANGGSCWSPDGKQSLWLVPRQKTDYSTVKMNLLFVPATGAPAKVLDLYQMGIGFVMAVDWR